ncbi:hypothetical protein ES703_124185 [subsurface metagenome]
MTLQEPQGIPPITKSTKTSYAGWSLPGHGEAYSTCGDWYYKGCLQVSAHRQNLLDTHTAGRVYAKRMMSTCLRAECPTCYEKWAAKEAHAITYRLTEAKKGRMYFGKAIHVTISLPKSDYDLVDAYLKLRPKVYKLLKKAGIFGGSMIFHPFRRDKMRKIWYFSPHFHILGYGWIRGKKVTSIYRSMGYIIKNHGVRKSVFATALYQLSHAGIKSGVHTVTWFGAVSYNKIKVKPEEVEPDVCPLCGAQLRSIVWLGAEGTDPIGDRPEGEYWIEPGGWAYSVRGGYPR